MSAPHSAESPGAVGTAGTAHRSLHARLAAGMLGIVLVLSALMGAVSTLTLRHTLMERLDAQLEAASDRSAVRRHGGSGSDSPSKAPLFCSSMHEEDEDEDEGDDEDDDEGAESIPPGLDAAGQPIGTLIIVSAGDGTGEGAGAQEDSAVTAGYIDHDGGYRSLSEAETAALLSLEPTGRPVSTAIDSLGDYRVLVSRDEVTGDVVVIGLAMAGNENLVRTQLLIEAVIALVGAIIAAVAGRAVVRSALAPLARVASAAERVSSQPLASGEVSIVERVDEEDLSSSQEVEQVGRSLNTLLDHVDRALAVRQRSETQVRQFVADASHELRTPLASIRGYTELIKREGAAASLPPEAVHALERVHSESLRMTGLVEDLLLLARLDAGRELRREEVDLLGILLDTVSDARAAGGDHVWELDVSALSAGGPERRDARIGGGAGGLGIGGITDRTDSADTAMSGARTEVGRSGRKRLSGPTSGSSAATGSPEALGRTEPVEDLDVEPPLVLGDEARLRQVLVNLLANARVHTPAGTRVLTRLERDGSQWVITISDNGPGIDPLVGDRLFERFVRGDVSRERRTGSTGLGTSIALAIVKSHGGTLTVSSVREGEDPERPGAHGTTFTLALPAA